MVDDAIIKIIDNISKMNQMALLTVFQIDLAIYKHECEVHNNKTSCELAKKASAFIKKKKKEIGD